MATKRTAKPKLQRIEPGTPEMEAYLAVGYGMDLEKAERIVAEREKDPNLWPYEQFEKAQAFLQAYRATPVAISTTPGWKRTRGV